MPKIKATEPEEIRKLIIEDLDQESKDLFNFLPTEIASQLLLDRDPHGNVQVAKIETEKLLITLVQKELAKNEEIKTNFEPLASYFGY